MSKFILILGLFIYIKCGLIAYKIYESDYWGVGDPINVKLNVVNKNNEF